MNWAFGRQSPDNNLMRFISRRIHPPAVLLDIGSGQGANATELRARGFQVWTVDIDPRVEADVPFDICTLPEDYFEQDRFDIIYDINTLCHVEHPPLEKIRHWLKPGGYFFSICPTERTWHGVADGKDFTRFASYADIRSMYKAFSWYEPYQAYAPDFRGNYLESWIIEAK